MRSLCISLHWQGWVYNNKKGYKKSDMNQNYFWVKKSDSEGSYKWLSVQQHLIDTENVARLLWNHWMSMGQKNIILSAINSCDEEDGIRLVQFLSAIHDIGKISAAFQRKCLVYGSKDLGEKLIERLEGLGFEGLRDASLPDAGKSPHALAGQYLLSKYGVNEEISSIIGSHHGKPVESKKIVKNQKAFESNYYQVDDKNSKIWGKWDKYQRLIFQWAMKKNGYDRVEDLPRISQPGQVLLSGILIMSDWIASNESFFPLVDIDVLIVESQDERYKAGWSKWFNTKSIEAKSEHDIYRLYKNRFDFEPRNLQKTFSEVVDSVITPGLFILEAPMGIGKTEAALIGVEQLSFKNGKSGLFMGLPTQATSNGIFSRVLSWLESVSHEENESFSIQLKHSKASLNSEYTSIAKHINIDETDFYDSEITTNQWFANYNRPIAEVISDPWFSGRKTSLLDDVVVGTVDQFLLAVLQQKHLVLRHLGLSKKVVIIDEVHAYDAYMSQYLERALMWMAAYNVPVILLSATLPAKSRGKLVAAYLNGKGIKGKNIKGKSEVSKATSYPLITYTDAGKACMVDNFEKQEEKEIIVEHLNKKCLYVKLNELFSRDGVVGIILNTVKEAQEIAAKCIELYGDEAVLLLHSSFISYERIKKENLLLKMIGKDASRPKKKIIIGTQVIEQSLDIDFDVLISDLAPMDLLLQRMGRLHRHDINRSDAYRTPVLYVMGTSDIFEFDSGSIHVYGEYLLAMTQIYLPKVVNIPYDISALVQKVYSDYDFSEKGITNCMKILKFKEEFNLDIKNKRNRAKTFLLSKPDLSEPNDENKDSLIGWLKNYHRNQSEEYGYAQVRDTQETIEVIAVKKFGNGYSLFDREEDVSCKLYDAEVTKRLAASTIKLPLSISHYGNADKVIQELEKINMKYLSEWQERVYLKGKLGLIFDQNGNAELAGEKLNYNMKYGLRIIRKENKNEQI